MPLDTPFVNAEVPLHDGILEELFNFCFFVPQQPAAILPHKPNHTADRDKKDK